MACVAKSSGAWNSLQTWGGSVPGPTDTIEIPAGITVSINSPSSGPNPYPAIVQLMNGGSLNVEGTLAINVASTASDSPSISGLATFQGASMTIKPGGVLNIAATGNTGPSATYHATGIWAAYNSQITNQGTININCHNLNGGLGFGILLDDPGVTLTNSGTIAIQATDQAQDGRGHCYGLWLRPGCLQNNSLITTTAQTSGSIKVEGGTFNNAGRFVNRGVLANGGSINNSGAITHVYPGASLQGGGVAGPGRINLSGSAPQAVSLDALAYGVKTYHVAAQDTLTAAGSLTVPAQYILVVSGALSVAGTFTNDGEVHYVLPGASYSGPSIQDTGKVKLRGQITAGSQVTLDGFGAKKYHVGLNETLQVGGTLTVPSGVTLKTDTWGKIEVLASGLVDNKGTLSNAGFIENSGTVRHWLPGAQFVGDATTLSGVTALAGTVSAPLSVNTFGAPEVSGAETYQVLASDVLTVSDTLTIPLSCILVVRGGIDNQGTLQNNGALTNNGFIKYRLPTAAYAGTGTYTDNGVIYLRGSTPEGFVKLNLSDYKGTRFQVGSGDLFMVMLGGMQLPAGCSLTVSGFLALRGRCFIAGSLVNEGEIDNGSWIVHVFPTARYSQTAAGSFLGQGVGLMGSISSDCSLDDLGYPAAATQFFVQWSLTLDATLTIPNGYTLTIEGTLGGSGTIATGSSGTLQCGLPAFLSTSYTGTVTGSGPLALVGTIDSADCFTTLNRLVGRSSFLVASNAWLHVQADVTIPDGFDLTNEGRLHILAGSSLTLGNPPANGVGVINNKGAFQSDGTLTITTSLAQKYGIFCSGTNASFSNNETGTIDIKNTAGVGLRFEKTVTNQMVNVGTINISGTYSTPTKESAAIANEVTLANQAGQTQGTIAAPTASASIFNSGTIFGGTYTGAQPTPNAWKATAS